MTKTDNELIAEFMGMVLETTEHEEGTDYSWTNCPPMEHWAFDSPPPFDRSWDWLMPVVEKINEYGIWVIRPDYVSIRSYDGELSPEKQFDFNTDKGKWSTADDEPVPFIFLVHSIVAQFIKWYNSQNYIRYE